MNKKLRMKTQGDLSIVELITKFANFIILLQFVPRRKMRKFKNIIMKMNKLIEKTILNEAYKRKIITAKEYSKKFQGRYIEDDIDSFPVLMGFVLKGASQFVTHNKRMLNERQMLEKRFGLKILDAKKYIPEYEEELQERPSYIN